MPDLTDTQATFLRGLFRAAPDAAVSSLEKALSTEVENGGAMAKVHGLVAHEAAERRLRAAVFGPLVAVCRPTSSRALRFPTRTIANLWEALRGAYPEQTARAEGAFLRDEDDAPEIYNELCAIVAEGLREASPAFGPAIEALAGAGPGAVAEFVNYLDLAPLTREALTKLPEWLGRLTEERAVAARIAYKDAAALSDDDGPRYFEILFANLPEPWLILRVLSAVMDRPADGYVAVSELAHFGEYVMEDIDRRLEIFSKFSPDKGREAGVAAGEAIRIAGQQISEFETSIELSNREGPWGKRLIKQRQTMAALAEARYAEIEKALDQALPQQMVKFGKGLRGHPKLTLDPDPRLLLRGEGLMGFFDHSRNYASQSGFGAARAKVAEKIEARLDQYVEDLLEMLRAEEIENLDRVRSYLEVSADFMEATRGEKAAQIVRRRAAAWTRLFEQASRVIRSRGDRFRLITACMIALDQRGPVLGAGVDIHRLPLGKGGGSGAVAWRRSGAGRLSSPIGRDRRSGRTGSVAARSAPIGSHGGRPPAVVGRRPGRCAAAADRLGAGAGGRRGCGGSAARGGALSDGWIAEPA